MNAAVVVLIWLTALPLAPAHVEEVDKPALRVAIILFWGGVMLGVAVYGFMRSA